MISYSAALSVQPRCKMIDKAQTDWTFAGVWRPEVLASSVLRCHLLVCMLRMSLSLHALLLTFLRLLSSIFAHAAIVLQDVKIEFFPAFRVVMPRRFLFLRQTVDSKIGPTPPLFFLLPSSWHDSHLPFHRSTRFLLYPNAMNEPTFYTRWVALMTRRAC